MWRGRRDSEPKSIRNQKVDNHVLKAFTKEQWSQISGEDCKILTDIFERWGSLSDELEMAVLRVVG